MKKEKGNWELMDHRFEADLNRWMEVKKQTVTPVHLPTLTCLPFISQQSVSPSPLVELFTARSELDLLRDFLSNKLPSQGTGCNCGFCDWWC